MTITVDGHAIQSTGFETADDAWAAFEAQVGTVSTTSDLPEGTDAEEGAQG
jgi:hypothetical protein